MKISSYEHILVELQVFYKGIFIIFKFNEICDHQQKVLFDLHGAVNFRNKRVWSIHAILWRQLKKLKKIDGLV